MINYGNVLHLHTEQSNIFTTIEVVDRQFYMLCFQLYSLLLSAAAGPLKTGCDPHHWLEALQAGIQAVSK